MRREPPISRDARCVVCGKGRSRRRREKKLTSAEYTRLDREIWLWHVERDPFCSRECCEAFYGLLAGMAVECLHCGKQFVRYRPRHLYCSRRCSQLERTKRRQERQQSDPVYREHYRLKWKLAAQKRRRKAKEAA